MDKKYSRFLINEEPIFFLPTLAKELGLNEAILLQKIHGWLQCKPHEAEGRCWIYNTYKSWQEQLPFLSERTIRRTIKNLTDKGIIIINNFNTSKFDKTNWYSIDYNTLDNVCNTDKVKLTSGGCQYDPTNTNIYNNNIDNIIIKNNNNIIVEQVINYMNELAGTSFKTTTKKTRSLIKARLDDGFTVEDLKDVVFYTYKEWVENKTQWHDGVYSDKYFRPSTIFAGDKIEGYLQDYKRNYD